MTARTGDVIRTRDDLDALIRQYAEAGAPAIVQEHGFRLWILTEDERGGHWAWSWREDDGGEFESEEGGTVVPVETLGLPLTVLHMPGEQKPTGDGWEVVDFLTEFIETVRDEPQFTAAEHALMGAGEMGRAGLLRQEPPTRDEIARAIQQATDDGAGRTEDYADAVMDLLKGEHDD